MALRDDLIAAKALIDTPEKWRKDEADDQPTCCAIVATARVFQQRDPDASLFNYANAELACWDALYRALPDEWQTSEDNPGECVGAFNDDPDTTHADIMALFDRAIAAASEAA